MARTYTRESLGRELARAREHGWEACCIEAERRASLPRALLLAVASRETDMNDVVGDGGHGRGLFQIDDRSHPAFLREHGAASAGGRPPVRDAARYAAQLVRDNLEYAKRKGVPEAERLKFALSAYNAGPGQRPRGLAGGRLGRAHDRRGLRPRRPSPASTTSGRSSTARSAPSSGAHGEAGHRAQGQARGVVLAPRARRARALRRQAGRGVRRGARAGGARLPAAKRRSRSDGVVGPKTLAALER